MLRILIKNKKLMAAIILIIVLLVGYYIYKNYFKEVPMAQVSNQMISYDIPLSAKANSEKIDKIDKSLESNKFYYFQNGKYKMHFCMDNFYICSAKIDIKKTYTNKKVLRAIKNELNLYPKTLKQMVHKSSRGIEKYNFKTDTEVLLTRDLFNDMSGYITLIKYRNEAYFVFAGTTQKDNKTAKKIANSIMFNSLNNIKTINTNKKADKKENLKIGDTGKIIVFYKKKDEFAQGYETYVSQTLLETNKDELRKYIENNASNKIKSEIDLDKKDYVLIKIKPNYTDNIDLKEYTPTLNPIVYKKDKKTRLDTKVIFTNINQDGEYEYIYKKPKEKQVYLRIGEIIKNVYIEQAFANDKKKVSNK